jgi:hypothetical protein
MLATTPAVSTVCANNAWHVLNIAGTLGSASTSHQENQPLRLVFGLGGSGFAELALAELTFGNDILSGDSFSGDSRSVTSDAGLVEALPLLPNGLPGLLGGAATWSNGFDDCRLCVFCLLGLAGGDSGTATCSPNGFVLLTSRGRAACNSPTRLVGAASGDPFASPGEPSSSSSAGGNGLVSIDATGCRGADL